jgi:hypothetical protein
MTEASNARVPLLVSVGFIAAGVVIAAAGGLTSGSVVGGVVAGLGVIPSLWAVWAGMQQKTQTSLGLAVVLVFASLGVGAILILLRVVDWLH